MTRHLTWNGKQLKSVYNAGGQAGMNDAYFSDLQDALLARSGNVVGNLSATAAYQSVPWLYRAVNLRAGLVGRMPFALMKGDSDVTDDPAYESILKSLKRSLPPVETSLCLSGEAYLYVNADLRGKNIEFVYLRAKFLKRVLRDGRLAGFSYTDSAQADIPSFIPLDRIIYFWNLNTESAAKPGPGEVQVALGAASVLWAIDGYAAGFFNSGGVKVSVFNAPTNITPADKEDFQNFLNRAMSGVRNAFRNIVLRGDMKPPVVIGSDLKETQAPELSTTERQSVAVALGLAPPVIDMEHANKATASVTMLALYTMTIIPRCDWIFEQIGDQFLDGYGLRLVTTPEQLEEVQQAELVQSAAVHNLVGRPIITINEGRDLVGYDEMTAAQEDELLPAHATAGQRADRWHRYHRARGGQHRAQPAH
jgi:HK97 family phage portal protein